MGKKLRAKSHDSNTIQNEIKKMNLPDITIKSETADSLQSLEVQEETTLHRSESVAERSNTPTQQEVEDFFDEILAVEVIPSSNFDDMQMEEMRRQMSPASMKVDKDEDKVKKISMDFNLSSAGEAIPERKLSQSGEKEKVIEGKGEDIADESQGHGMKRNPLKRDDTVQTEHSEESADSGMYIFS